MSKYLEIINTPMRAMNMNITAADYHNVKIEESGEPLVKLEMRPGIKFFDQSRLPKGPRTNGFYLRKTAAEKLYAAGAYLFDLTNGELELYVRDGYRLIEMQRQDWAEGVRNLTAELGNFHAAQDAAKVLYSDPTGFDENDPSTWAHHTPSHTTGGAVDVFIIANRAMNVGDWLYMDRPPHRHPDRIGHYETRYFEGRTGLSEIEQMVMKNRRLLVHVMEANGFYNYPREAWHFDYGDQMARFTAGSSEPAIYGYIKRPKE